jgi:hypothetical protein
MHEVFDSRCCEFMNPHYRPLLCECGHSFRNHGVLHPHQCLALGLLSDRSLDACIAYVPGNQIAQMILDIRKGHVEDSTVLPDESK